MKKSIAALISFYVFVSSLFSYTYSGSNNLRSDCASWQVADERMETFWQLAENEEEGFIQITGPEEKKEKIIISAEIAEKSR